MPKHPKRPRDPNQLAHIIAGIAIGDIDDTSPDQGKNPAAIERGRKGGLIGGKARAAKLSAAQRKKISRKAIKTRWGKR